jgi:hypothetical protein
LTEDNVSLAKDVYFRLLQDDHNKKIESLWEIDYETITDAQ